MTCIVGLVHGGQVFIGGDSAGVGGGYSLTVRSDRKVFKNQDFVMGFTSSFRMGQLLAFHMHPPSPREGVDLMTYMVTDFIDAARVSMKAGGYSKIENGVESGGTFLVGYKGRLFCVYSDFQVADIAIGSLFATRNLDDPHTRLEEALKAAEAFNAGVRGPFFFESTQSTIRSQ